MISAMSGIPHSTFSLNTRMNSRGAKATLIKLSHMMSLQYSCCVRYLLKS